MVFVVFIETIVKGWATLLSVIMGRLKARCFWAGIVEFVDCVIGEDEDGVHSFMRVFGIDSVIAGGVGLNTISIFDRRGLIARDLKGAGLLPRYPLNRMAEN